MDINLFVKAVLEQDEINLKRFFHDKAIIKWHCTNELFSVNEYVKVNCKYPGEWSGDIEKIEKFNNNIILVLKVFPKDKSEFFHVVSFIKLENNLIVEMDEYWSEDTLIPKWREEMKLGKKIKR